MSATWQPALILTDNDDDVILATVRQSSSPGFWCVEIDDNDPYEDLAHSKEEAIAMAMQWFAENDVLTIEDVVTSL